MLMCLTWLAHIHGWMIWTLIFPAHWVRMFSSVIVLATVMMILILIMMMTQLRVQRLVHRLMAVPINLPAHYPRSIMKTLLAIGH